MERIIGRKYTRIGFLYWIVAGFGILQLISLLPAIFQGVEAGIIIIIMIGVFGSLCFKITYSYFKVPKNAIIQINNDEIYLPGYKKSILLSDITNILCERSRSRTSGYHEWGTILISTKDNAYTVKYLADCEDTAAYLRRLREQSSQK